MCSGFFIDLFSRYGYYFFMATASGFRYHTFVEEPLYESYGVLYHSLSEPSVKTHTSDYWFKMGKLHRLDGPAIERRILSSQKNEWYIEGIKYTQKDFELAVSLIQQGIDGTTIANL